jgi:hypothetical protein
MWPIRTIIAAAVISATLTQVSRAQLVAPTAVPPSDDDKMDYIKKQKDEKATDEAYKAAMKRLRNDDQKADPWGGIRTPSANGSK